MPLFNTGHCVPALGSQGASELHHSLFVRRRGLLWLVFGAAAGGDNVEQPSLSYNCAGI